MPAAEEAHRALMRVYRARGSQNSALRQFELCKQALRHELQSEPDAETRRIVAIVQQFDRLEYVYEATPREAIPPKLIKLRFDRPRTRPSRSCRSTISVMSPDFTVRRYLEVPTFRDMPEYRDQLAQGLRDAGLPEG